MYFAHFSIFNLPLQTHCRIVYKLCPFKHVEHSLKCRFIKFMSCNLQSRNDIIRYIANMCFNDKSSQSGRMYYQILNEYNVPIFEMADSILHQMNSFVYYLLLQFSMQKLASFHLILFGFHPRPFIIKVLGSSRINRSRYLMHRT